VGLGGSSNTKAVTRSLVYVAEPYTMSVLTNPNSYNERTVFYPHVHSIYTFANLPEQLDPAENLRKSRLR
jgi:hypothetical protein